MKAQLEIITPAVANQMLDTNKRNRPLSIFTVERYAADMSAGRWKPNGQTIIIDTNGDLLDGQHRLRAIVKANKPQGMLVARNVAADSFDTIDNGKPRSLADVLGMQGYAYMHVTAGAARISYLYISGQSMSATPSRVALTDFVEGHPYLQEAGKIVRMHKMRFPNAPLAAALFLGNENRNLDDEVDAFIEGTRSGADLSRGDPRLALREWEINERMRSRGMISTLAAFGASVRAWNAYASGKTLTIIKGIQSPSRTNIDVFGFQGSLYRDVPNLSARKVDRPRENGKFVRVNLLEETA